MVDARYLGAVKETGDYGTPVSVDQYYDIISESLESNQNPLLSETAGSRSPRSARPGPFEVSGGIDMYAEAKELGCLLNGLCGVVTTDTSGSPVFVHKFSPGLTIPSLTLEIGADDQARRFPGSIIKGMTFEATAKELLSISLDVVAQKETIETIGVPSFSTSNFLTYHEGTVKIATVESTVVEAFRCNIANDIGDGHIIGSRFLPRIQLQGLEVTGDFDLMFTSWSEYKRFLGGSTSSTGAGNAIAGSPTVLRLEAKFINVDDTNEYLELIFPSVIYDVSKANIDKRERKIQNVSWKAIGYSAATPFKPFEINLSNNVAAASAY